MDDFRSTVSTQLRRLSSAVGRRVRRRWGMLQGTRPPLAESAFGWLLRAARDEGIALDGGHGPICLELTAALLPTLAAFGETRLVRRWQDLKLPAGGQPADESLPRRLEQAVSRQRRDGSVPVHEGSLTVSSAELAQWAVMWYRNGYRAAADRALACLARRQRADGSWPVSWGASSRDGSDRASAWTAKFVLDASAAQVAAAFDRETPGLDEPLAPNDGRLAVVQAMVDNLSPTARVVDVGCGSGRYLTRLARLYPSLQLTGIDPSHRCVRNIESANAVVGNILRLPLDDGSFDAAVCIEALEHALIPERAVAELCRVVRPGGRVLIIDKDERFRSLSLCETWERWFTPQSLVGLLSPFCHDATCTPLPPGPHQRTPGLFLAWQGVRC